MFLIVDNTRRKMRDVAKAKFDLFNIPCVISDTEHCDAFMPATIIIVTEEYLLTEVKYMSSFYGCQNIVLWDDQFELFDYAIHIYREIFGLDILYARRDPVMLNKAEVYIRDRKVRMTDTEIKIIRYLIANKGWNNRDLIARYCLKRGFRDKEAVAVHICNINNKLKRLKYKNLIKSKRFLGYKI